MDSASNSSHLYKGNLYGKTHFPACQAPALLKLSEVLEVEVKMTERQLQDLRRRIGAHPNLNNLHQNGRLLHLMNPLFNFNEWAVLTYNMQILGDQIKENSKLREKLDNLVDDYVKQLETSCKMRPLGPTAHPIQTPDDTISPYPSDAMLYWITMMNQRLEDLEKRVKKMEELMLEQLEA
ncbi:hypothetical protein ACJRO7_015858 [Eucalyptus globulus]|uniref:Uncharacterized protein n=1 Tax=Eucalyptus globulus TaxID=34317 RepID=A0ABD3LFC1_EUCGL